MFLDDRGSEQGRLVGPQVGTDLLCEPRCPIEDSAPDHDLHSGPGVDLANRVDHLSNRGGVRCRGCEQQKNVGIASADIGKDVVGRNATAGETNLMSIPLQDRGDDLTLELLGMGGSAVDQDPKRRTVAPG